jgi:Domain of unknown function (DUF4440)
MTDTQAFCTECGAAVKGARFCPSCGARSQNEFAEGQPTERGGVVTAPTRSTSRTTSRPAELPRDAAAPEPPPDARSRGHVLIFALGVGLVAVLIAGAVILLSGGGTKHTVILTTPSTTPSQQTSTQAASAPVSEGQAKALAYEYGAAFSGKNLNLLGSLLTSDFRRTNAGDPPQNRKAALAAYEKQFSQLSNPQYVLSKMKVTRTHDTAVVAAAYSISSSAGVVTGSVWIDMVRVDGKLMIKRIIAIPDVKASSGSNNGNSGSTDSGSSESTAGSADTGSSGSTGGSSGTGPDAGGSGGGTSDREGPGGLLYYGPELPITPVPNLG